MTLLELVNLLEHSSDIAIVTVRTAEGDKAILDVEDRGEEVIIIVDE